MLTHNFILYLKIGKDYVPISDTYDFSTYDENLTQSENDQYTLTFSVAKSKYENNTICYNPLLSFYYIGAQLRVVDNNQIVDLVIKSITPVTGNVNTVFNISAQDEVSYLWSKHNVGYNYSTLNSEGLLTSKNIFTIAKEVLKDNFLTEWSITSHSLDAELENQLISLNITNSNPYNVLIEAANTLNAYLKVNYNTKKLDFYRKNLVGLSGYRYRPDYNALNYTANYSGEQLTTMLHINGGTDANERQITIVPPMPESVRKYFFVHSDNAHNWDKILNDDFTWADVRSHLNDKYYISALKLGSVIVCNGQHYKITNLSYNNNQLIVYFSLERSAELYFTVNATFNSDTKYYYIEPYEQNEDGLYLLITNVYAASNNINVFNDATITYGIECSYISNPSPAFLPIVAFKYKTSNLYWNSENCSYIVKYNDVKGVYEGIITYDNQEEDASKHIYYSLTFAIDYKAAIPFMCDNIVEENALKIYNNISAKYINLLDPNDVPTIVVISVAQSFDDIHNNEQKIQRMVQEDIDKFFAIAYKIPYLGQSLIDIDIFKPHISMQQWIELNNIINYKWRNYNIQLQYYSNEYYDALIALTRLRQNILNYGEIYSAACVRYQKFIDRHNNVLSIQNNAEQQDIIKSILEAQQNLYNVIKNSNYIQLLEYIGIDDELEISENVDQYFSNIQYTIKNNIKDYYNTKLSLLSSSNTDTFITNERQGQITYYNNLIQTSQELINNFKFTINGKVMLGMYPLIIHYMHELQSNVNITKGIAFKYNSIKTKINNEIFSFLYQNYGHLIYENTYENTEEIDSIGLFNQAIVYFADLNKIQSSHSLEVLDIGMLEQISVPKLSVGSLIQVQNKNSINAQPYYYLLGEIDRHMSLAQYYKNNNTLKYAEENNYIQQLRLDLIEQYKHNNPTIINITYEEIIDKIYNDTIFVTAISKVLRAPLKLSITVEQPSRYKTILSKLIKSI